MLGLRVWGLGCPAWPTGLSFDLKPSLPASRNLIIAVYSNEYETWQHEVRVESMALFSKLRREIYQAKLF